MNKRKCHNKLNNTISLREFCIIFDVLALASVYSLRALELRRKYDEVLALTRGFVATISHQYLHLPILKLVILFDSK